MRWIIGRGHRVHPFFLMFRYNGVNKDRSTQFCRRQAASCWEIRDFIVVGLWSICPVRKESQWAWKPDMKSFTFTSWMYAHYFDLAGRVDGRNITVKCILHVGASCISSSENATWIVLKRVQMQRLVGATSPPQPHVMLPTAKFGF